MDPDFSVDYEEPVVGGVEDEDKNPQTPTVPTPPKAPENPKTETNSNTNQTSKPQTGDSSIVLYLATGVLALVGLITARKFD